MTCWSISLFLCSPDKQKVNFSHSLYKVDVTCFVVMVQFSDWPRCCWTTRTNRLSRGNSALCAHMLLCVWCSIPSVFLHRQSVCLCVCVAFSVKKEGRCVGGKLASLISRLIDCEKFEDDILRKRGGRGMAWLIWLKRSANECQPVT